MDETLHEYFVRLQIWETASLDPGLDPTQWRRDPHGRRMRMDDYGDMTSLYGWLLAGAPLTGCRSNSKYLFNIRALHWKSQILEDFAMPTSV
jgi:hypothetical protein